MSREVDNLIAYHAASGAPGVLTDVNTPGVHSSSSAHYAAGTCSPPTAMDHSSGCMGCAADFAFEPPQSMSPGLLAIWAAFSHVESQLWELFYEGADYWIKSGKRMAKTAFSQALRTQHQNHVHVAIHRGTVLPLPNQPTPAPPAPAPQENDMSAELTIRWADGSLTIADVQGNIKNAGSPFFGAAGNLRVDEKQDFGPVFALTPVDPANKGAGYVAWVIGAKSGQVHQFRFDLAFAQSHGV